MKFPHWSAHPLRTYWELDEPHLNVANFVSWHWTSSVVPDLFFPLEELQDMGKARGEGARKFVVYSDPLKPLDFGGWPIEQAFDALLKQCGYAADWDVTETAVLRLRHADGPHKGIPVGVLSPVDHPRAFSADIMRGNNGQEMARRHIMGQVLSTGLNGWRGDTRERFSVLHGLAEQRRRNPELFPPDGR